MDRKQHRPRSVDGIYQPHRPVVRKAPQANYLARPPVKSADTTPPPTQPKLTLHSDNPSLLNTTLVPRSFQPVEDPRRKNGKRPKHRAGWSGWSRKRKIVTSTLALLLIGFSLGGWYGARLIGNLDKAFHGNVFSDAQALFSQVKLNGETQGRVNILIAGDSADDPGHAGADLTDSIMVLSIDTQNHTAFMLSIPRDLWVNIPGLGNQKINAANDVTNFSAAGYPSGGMGQLEQIVQTDLGIPIDYDALVNYDAFKDAVNAVGGITVDIQSPDPRGLYDSNTNLNLPNGEDTLNGQTALNLARARGDNDGDISYGFPDTDFDRTQHQRQMVVAIAKKATTLGVLANPLKVNQLFAAVANNVQTDLTLQDALRLAQIGKGINLNTIGSYTYSSSTTGQTSPLLVGYTDPDSGEDSLAPSAGVGNFGQLQQYYQQLTSTNPVVKEGASVVVLNGSDVIGLAKQEEGVLQTKGVDTVTIADANNEYPSTMIVDNSAGKDPATKQLLEQLYPGTTVTTDTGSLEAGEAQGYTSNFVVVLGKNWDSTPNQ
jgi:LCP family protein required for cell wall assembly